MFYLAYVSYTNPLPCRSSRACLGVGPPTSVLVHQPQRRSYKVHYCISLASIPNAYLKLDSDPETESSPYSCHLKSSRSIPNTHMQCSIDATATDVYQKTEPLVSYERDGWSLHLVKTRVKRKR